MIGENLDGVCFNGYESGSKPNLLILMGTVCRDGGKDCIGRNGGTTGDWCMGWMVGIIIVVLESVEMLSKLEGVGSTPDALGP